MTALSGECGSDSTTYDSGSDHDSVEGVILGAVRHFGVCSVVDLWGFARSLFVRRDGE